MAKEANAQAKAKVGSKPLGHGVGRRKSAVARVWLKRGSGKIVVNGKDYADYFTVAVSQMAAQKPFEVLPQSKQFDAHANVVGGGFRSQAGAVMLGIARAFLDHDAEVKPVLKQDRLLTVDSRNKERKKYGQRGARRKFQFVKR
jgi:small subunit ribosomal protein S9